ncbi:MAG TPA: helix-hairpin-helix domain-containing protein [Herpetosiphonaceae bacterium]
MADDSANEIPDVGGPVKAALAAAGYRLLDQLAAVTEAEIAKLHGVGPKGLRLLRQAMQAQGLDFADKRGDLPAVSAPAARALAAAGITRLDQLAAVAEAEISALHGVGPKVIRVLRAAMRERGLDFSDKRGEPAA